MILRPRLYYFLFCALSILLPGTARADDYPTAPIRLYTTAAGGTADVMARLIAQNADLGQPIVVINKPVLDAAESVAQARPDGYSLLVLGDNFYLGPIFQETPYDPTRDFTPVAMLTTSPNVLVTNPSLPASVDGIVAMAKAQPGALNYATGAPGGSPDLAGQMFDDLAGVKMVRVPYKGGNPAIVAVMSGESQITFGTPSEISSIVAGGKLRALAVTSAGPSDLMPGLPPLSQFLPGFEITSVQGIWTTAKTPAPIVNRLNQEIKRILELPDVKKRLYALGMDAAYSSPEDFSQEITADIAKTRKLKDESSKK